MNKTIKRQWVKALRSGKYKQGREALRNIDNTYCCLGILCNVLGAEWYDGMPKLNGKCLNNEESGVVELSYETLEKVGIDVVVQDKLIIMNDGDINNKKIKPKSFNVIANYIEKYL